MEKVFEPFKIIKPIIITPQIGKDNVADSFARNKDGEDLQGVYNSGVVFLATGPDLDSFLNNGCVKSVRASEAKKDEPVLAEPKVKKRR